MSLRRIILEELREFDWIESIPEDNYAEYAQGKIEKFISRFTQEWEEDVYYDKPKDGSYENNLGEVWVYSESDTEVDRDGGRINYESHIRMEIRGTSEGEKELKLVAKDYKAGRKLNTEIEHFTNIDDMLQYIFEYLAEQ